MHTRTLRLSAGMLILWGEMLWGQISIGPYVQRTTPDRATVIWYTATPTSGSIRYGASSGEWLGAVEVTAGTVHAAEITGLQPDTKYFYEVSNGATVFATGPDYYFTTHPPVGSRLPFSFLAAGDLGDGSSTQKAVAARMMQERPNHKFALLLGDIVYGDGLRSEYLQDYFPVYKDLIRHFCFWPTLGNHDVDEDEGTADAYFEFFYTPTNNPCGVENYYSFDYANAHLVSMDDELLISGAALTNQLNWVKSDLADAKRRGLRWLIVMFHKPPYTNGTHEDEPLTKNNFVPVLEAAGVDLVLCGHSHVAERSFLLNNHQIVNTDLRNYPKDGVVPGTVYVVSGSGGKSGSINGPHPLLAFQQGKLAGFEIIYIHGDTLRGKFMKSDGAVIDNFTITKKGDTSSIETPSTSEPPKLFAWHYPNPFRVATSDEELRIVFEISLTLPVQAVVFDVVGRVVTRLRQGEIFPAGRHELRWNGRNADGQRVPTGLYFYQLQAGAQTQTAKVLVIP